MKEHEGSKEHEGNPIPTPLGDRRICHPVRNTGLDTAVNVGLCLASPSCMTDCKKSEHAYQVIGACIHIHRKLGPGLFESVYEACVTKELLRRGVPFERQVEIPIIYEGERIGRAFRADLVVGGTLLVELKSVERLHPLHNAQVLTYLRLSGLSQALLINFNVPILRHGIKSFVGPAAQDTLKSQE